MAERVKKKYRARANGEIRELTPSEAAALVPGIYEPLEDDEERSAAKPQQPAKAKPRKSHRG